MDVTSVFYPCIIHTLSTHYPYIIHIHSSSMDYPRFFKEFVTLSTHYPKNIQGLSNHLTLDNGWINPRSTSPTFVLTLSTFLEVQGVEDKPMRIDVESA